MFLSGSNADSALSIIYLLKEAAGYYTTVECPARSPMYGDYDFPPPDCTLLTSCTDPLEISESSSSPCARQHFHNDDYLFDCYTGNGRTCAMKHKVTMLRNWDFSSVDANLCSNTDASSEPSLLPISSNCSLVTQTPTSRPLN